MCSTSEHHQIISPFEISSPTILCHVQKWVIKIYQFREIEYVPKQKIFVSSILYQCREFFSWIRKKMTGGRKAPRGTICECIVSKNSKRRRKVTFNGAYTILNDRIHCMSKLHHLKLFCTLSEDRPNKSYFFWACKDCIHSCGWTTRPDFWFAYASQIFTLDASSSKALDLQIQCAKQRSDFSLHFTPPMLSQLDLLCLLMHVLYLARVWHPAFDF